MSFISQLNFVFKNKQLYGEHIMKKLLIIFCFTSLTSCVTPYKNMSLIGGYSEMALSKDTYKVLFRGNGFSSQDYVYSSLLRRSAELTIQNGYKYFIILGSNTANHQTAINTPATIQSNSYGNFNGYGNINATMYGNTINGDYSSNGSINENTYTTIRPGQTEMINHFSSTAIIKMLMTDKYNPSAFNANVILSNYQNRK